MSGARPISLVSAALDSFRKGLRELGWVEGKTFAIESRFADGKSERLPELAAELVRQRVESVPGVTRVAVLTNPRSIYTAPFMQERESMVRRLGLQLPILEATDPGSFEKAFAAVVSDRASRRRVACPPSTAPGSSWTQAA